MSITFRINQFCSGGNTQFGVCKGFNDIVKEQSPAFIFFYGFIVNIKRIIIDSVINLGVSTVRPI